MNRRPIFDSRGQDTGATFGVEPRGRALTIRFDSRGTTAGTRAYRAGLVLLLTRLADLGAEISDVAVDSLTVKNLSRADRRLKLSGRKYPLAFPRRGGGVGPDVVAHEVEALRKSFHTAAAKVGRPVGARGGGNGTKKLRLYVANVDLTADELEDKLAGKGGN
jgi:hypothetical protein